MAETFFDRVHKNDSHTPDVLSCLANLSNDEVFTSPEIVNNMLDMLPQKLFSDPDTKFLDPACKTGVFLREIAKRLLIGLEPIYPDLQERIDHIFHEQLYGIAITELTSLLSRRSLYCSKYPNGPYSITKFQEPEGNIRFKKINHTWKDGNCICCGANEKQYKRKEELETHAYEFIHLKGEEIFNMKFDVIISNPPYQLSDGGSNASAIPLYNLFVEKAKKLSPRYISMIIPSRWFAGGRALDDFRNDMLTDHKLKELVDYQQSHDCFPGVDIAGGVCYFLWEKEYNGLCKVTNCSGNEKYSEERKLDEFPIFVRSNIGVDIVKKVLSKNFASTNKLMANYNPFLIRSFVVGEKEKRKGYVKLLSSKGFGYINPDTITKNVDLISKYKLICSKVTAEHAGECDKNGQYRVLSSLRILKPNEVCTESYVVLASFDTYEETYKMMKYYSLKFVRFLIMQASSSINLTQNTFMFTPIPVCDVCSDESLYKYYDLNKKEIEYIEKLMKPYSLEDN